MAITVTELASGAVGWPAATGADSFVTASISPGANCHLVLLFGVVTNSSDPFGSSFPTCVSSGSGPSWTLIGESGAHSTTYRPGTAGFHAAIGGSDPGSFTVSVDWTTTDGIYAYSLWKVTGHDTTTPLGGFVFTKEQPGNGANTITLSAAPATDDVTLALSIADENSANQGATFGTGTWTETGDGATDASGVLAWNAGYRTGSTSDQVPWSDVNTGTDTFGSAQCAVVVQVDPGGAGVTGTVAETLDAFTSSASGFVQITGTVAETLDAFTSTASGMVEPLPYVHTSAAGALTASDDPSITFAGYTPQLNDLVVLFISATTPITVQANASLPSGWVNPLGDGVEVVSDSHGIAVLYHLVTSGEVSGGTTTYTATNALTTTFTGRVHGVVVRNHDPTSPIDNFGTTFNSGNTVTPHVLAAITGTGSALSDDSLVVSSVAADGTGTYGSVPTGWTQLQTAGTTQGRWTGYRDALTTANTDVTATNITPSAGDEYASISLAISSLPNRAGTVAVTLAAFTSSASGSVDNPPVTGTVAETLDAFVSTASGTSTPPAITGTVAVTLGAFVSTAQGSQGLWPTAVSGRKIVDQTGHVYQLKCLSSWGMSQNLTNAEITQALEDVADLGFNAVNIAPCGVGIQADWVKYENIASDDFFTGTAFQSSFGSAWATYDHIVDEALRLGLTVLVTHWVSFASTGSRPEMEAATNAQMRTYGQTLATRYGDYPNIIWHIMGDVEFDADDTIGRRLDYLFRGITETESVPHLVLAEQSRDLTAYQQFINQEGTDPTGYEWFVLSANAMYRYEDDAVDEFDAVWNESGATTYPVWDCEPPYVDSPNFGGTFNQQLRERVYSVFFRGGCGINFGHEGWWPFGKQGLFTSVDWEVAITDTQVVEASYAWEFIDSWCMESNFGPTASFVTTGLGTGDTKAGQGASGVVAVAYFPSSRTIQVDTTILAGTGNVTLEWFDPTDNSYTTIASSEAQQTGRSVTHPGNNSAGHGDWILVVSSSERDGTVAETLDPFVSAAAGTVAPPPITGTVAETLDAFTSTASGTSTPPAFTGTVAETLDPFTSTASGTFTPPPITGTVAETLDPFTSTASGTSTPPAFTGTVAETLDPFTSTASGTVAPPAFTGTVAETLDPFTSTASGTVVVPGFAGNGAVTLAPFVAAAAGTFTPPAITGTVAVTLGPFVANGQEGESTNITVVVGPPSFSTRTASVATRTRSATHAMHSHVAGVPDGVDRSVSHTMVAKDAGDPDTRDRSATIRTAHGSPDPPTL